MTPDFVFCHGPFLQGKLTIAFSLSIVANGDIGDYQIGATLLSHAAMSMQFCPVPPPEPPRPASPPMLSKLNLPTLSRTERSRTPSPEPALAAVPHPPQPRRIVVFVLGIKAHRAGIWTSSHRPGESVMQYILLSGAPAIVLPAALGSPLVAWYTKTLEQLWKFTVPEETAATAAAEGEAVAKEGGKDEAKANTFVGALAALTEFVGMCVDWARVEVPGAAVVDEQVKRRAVRETLALVLAAAVRSSESAKVKKEIEADRAGIVVWRIP